MEYLNDVTLIFYSANLIYYKKNLLSFTNGEGGLKSES